MPVRRCHMDDVPWTRFEHRQMLNVVVIFKPPILDTGLDVLSKRIVQSLIM
jgi:hypothetical protein